MSDHDISVDSDGQDGEERDSDEAIASEREELAKKSTMSPGTLPESGGG